MAGHNRDCPGLSLVSRYFCRCRHKGLSVLFSFFFLGLFFSLFLFRKRQNQGEGAARTVGVVLTD